jgi:hypothetical protein
MRGFTLIEAMIYLALVTGLIGSALHAAQSISSSAAGSAARVAAEENGAFVMAKARWLARCAETLDSRQDEIIFADCQGWTYHLGFDRNARAIVLSRGETPSAAAFILARGVDSFGARADGRDASALRISLTIAGIPFEALLLP